MVSFVFAGCSLSGLVGLVFQSLYEVISFTPAVVAGVDNRFLCESVPTRLAFKVSILTWGG